MSLIVSGCILLVWNLKAPGAHFINWELESSGGGCILLIGSLKVSGRISLVGIRKASGAHFSLVFSLVYCRGAHFSNRESESSGGSF